MTLSRIRWRRDTETNWAAVNPVLTQGEAGLVIPGGGSPNAWRFKLGDGSTAWNSLPFHDALLPLVGSGDSRLSDAREWSAATVSQTEAEEGAATTRRAWTAERVRQAIVAWWLATTSAFGRSLVSAADATAGRTALGLGTAATTDSTAYATAAQGVDAREWTASTVSPAEAEAGNSTVRRAWTAERVFQAIAAWWIASGNELSQDATAALFTGGTHTGISFSYDDAGNRINATVTGGGGGGGTRQTASTTLAALASGATATGTITLPRMAVIISIQASRACWFRLYNSAAAQSADVSRPRTTAPAQAAGVIADPVFTGASTIELEPTLLAANRETTPNTTYPVRATNDGATGDVVVTITFLTLQT